MKIGAWATQRGREPSTWGGASGVTGGLLAAWLAWESGNMEALGAAVASIITGVLAVVMKEKGPQA